MDNKWDSEKSATMKEIRKNGYVCMLYFPPYCNLSFMNTISRSPNQKFWYCVEVNSDDAMGL